MSKAELTSPTLMALIRTAAASLYPPVPDEGLSKRELLERIGAQAGWPAVFEAGRSARALSWHPVVQALSVRGAAISTLERWLRLERFGHARNRTMLIHCSRTDEGEQVVLQHVGTDGGATEAVDDLFIWGVLVGLLEVSGVAVAGAHLASSGGLALVEQVTPTPPLPAQTHLLHLRCRSGLVPQSAPPAVETQLVAGLGTLLAADPVRAWTTNETARALGISRRAMQRELQRAGTTFSAVLQRVRLARARALLADERLTLTDIAFCAGFSDQAHFSRLFRRHFDVPPSELRALLRGADLRS